MALYQNEDNREIRYLKNLEREQKIIGNYYRDIIRQYGIDVNYYKLKIPYMDHFKTIIDENTILRHAYGYEEELDYSISAKMISYMEVQDDLLQLGKFGIVPNTDVTFYFDSKDFACSLAEKLGQLKEYKVKETHFEIEVPEIISDQVEYEYNGQTYTYSLSDDIFPYAIGYGVPEKFESEILTGIWGATIGPYELDTEYTIPCEILEHGDVKLEFPTNIYTASSFKRKVKNEDFVETMLFLTYKVTKVKVGADEYKFILHGHLHGGTLFNDLNKVGKYMDLIHPDVGDIVTIEFPTKESRQQYEITDCTDKQMTNDGINPLLGRYVWKCKAKRYVNSGDGFPERNEDNERIQEGLEMLNNADEVVAKKTSSYDSENNDAVYGGYERELKPYDRRQANPNKDRLEFIDDGSWIEIFQFADTCKLVTDGYELYYVDSKEQCYKLTTVEDVRTINENLVASGLQYIKASDNALFFVNFDNKCCKICETPEITQGEIEMCANSLIDTTLDIRDHNKSGQYFYKFRESNTVLMSIEDNLYCRLGNSKRQIIKLT